MLSLLLALLCLWAYLAPGTTALAEQSLTALAHWSVPLREPLRDVLTGDVDGDGQREILLVGRNGYLALLEADGKVVWQNQLNEETYAACLADLDEDGASDLVIGGPRGVTALRGDGGQLWFYRTGYAVDSLCAADANGDRRVEIVAATSYEHVYQLGSDGKVIWHYWPASQGFGGTVRGLAIADIDDDGKKEVAVAFDFPGYKALQPAGHIRLLDDDGKQVWLRTQQSPVLSIAAFDPDGWGKYLLAAGTEAGEFMILFGDGAMRWHYQLDSPVFRILSGDVDGDQQEEVMAVTERRVVALDDDGSLLWERAAAGQDASAFSSPDSASSLVAQEATPPSGRDASVPSSGDRAGGSQRVVNAALGDSEGSVGRLVAVLYLPPGPPRGIVELVDIRGGIQESYLLPAAASMVLLSDLNMDGQVDLLVSGNDTVQLLSRARGVAHIRLGWTYTTGDTTGAGKARGEVAALDATDVDGDGRFEVLLGSQDQNLYVLKDDGSLSWRYPAPGVVRTLNTGDVDGDGQREVMVGYNKFDPRGDPQGWGLSVLRGDGRVLWQFQMDNWLWSACAADLNGDGRQEVIVGTSGNQVLAIAGGHLLWSYPTAGTIVGLFAADLNGGGRAGVLAGSEDNRAYVLFPNGTLRWSYDAGRDVSVVRAADLNDDSLSEALIASDQGMLYALRLDGVVLWRQDLLDAPLALYAGDFAGDGRTYVAVGTRGGQVFLLDQDGSPVWQYALQARLLSLFPGDVDGDRHAEIVAGSVDGVLYVLTQAGKLQGRYEVGEGVTALWVGDLDADGRAEILAGTRDGRLAMYEYTPNRPPLVANCSIAPAKAGYVYAVSVDDREGDPVEVSLEVLEPFSRAWKSAGSRSAAKPGTLYWFVDPFPLLAAGRTAAYRLTYSDGLNAGAIGPLPGPKVPGMPWYTYGMLPLAVALFALGYRTWRKSPARYARLLYGRLSRSPQDILAAMHQLAASGVSQAETLMRLSRRAWAAGDPTVASLAEGYLLLSSRPVTGLQVVASALAQRTGDAVAEEECSGAGEAVPDAERSAAGEAVAEGEWSGAGEAVPLSRAAEWGGGRGSALSAEATQAKSGSDLDQSRAHSLVQMYRLLADLAEANSVARIAVLRPQMQRTLRVLEAQGTDESPQQEALEPLREALRQFVQAAEMVRSSERIEALEDKLDYLARASESLSPLADRRAPRDRRARRVDPEAKVVAQIAANWQRVISAVREDWLGRAQLHCRLRTRRIVAGDEALLVLEVQNKGRSPALQVTAELVEDGHYKALGAPVALGTLAAGRMHEVQLPFVPPAERNFRAEFVLRYDDAEAAGKAQRFADMVEVLVPSEFRVVPNPYVPGRPLECASPIFYGREDVFDFVAHNARGLLQRNILILIGQRRTGKTSMLLQLPLRLGEAYLPVYLDCQSLGLTPGLSSWLYDVAVASAEALAERGVRVTVPEWAAFERQPGRVFEHDYLQQVQSALEDRTLVLVLDEFEELEMRVRAGRLDPTVFPYMRHLMQHAPQVAFVFVGTHRLEEMTTDYWSVLFNIALYRHIGFLDESSAQHLICEPVRPYNMVYDDLALNRMLQVTAGHPYFLQLLCYSLVNAHNRNQRSYITIADVDQSLEEILTLGGAHFSFLWETCGERERATLLALTRLLPRLGMASWPQLGATGSDVAVLLAERGLRLDPRDVSAALRGLAAREILQQVPGDVERYVFKVGLVALWIERYKSLQKVIEELMPASG